MDRNAHFFSAIEWRAAFGWPTPEIISAYAELVTAFQWPLVALIVSAFFRNQIRGVISRMKRGKVFGQEFELADDLEALKTQVEASAQETVRPEPPDTQSSPSTLNDSADLIEREVLEVASLSPRAAVMLVGAEIEQYMRWLAANAEYNVRPFASVRQIAEVMVKEGALSPNTQKSLEQFWRLRNRIVHEFAGDDKENLAVTDIGLSLLRQIRRV